MKVELWQHPISGELDTSHVKRRSIGKLQGQRAFTIDIERIRLQAFQKYQGSLNPSLGVRQSPRRLSRIAAFLGHVEHGLRNVFTLNPVDRLLRLEADKTDLR